MTVDSNDRDRAAKSAPARHNKLFQLLHSDGMQAARNPRPDPQRLRLPEEFPAADFLRMAQQSLMKKKDD